MGYELLFPVYGGDPQRRGFKRRHVVVAAVINLIRIAASDSVFVNSTHNFRQSLLDFQTPTLINVLIQNLTRLMYFCPTSSFVPALMSAVTNRDSWKTQDEKI